MEENKQLLIDLTDPDEIRHSQSDSYFTPIKSPTQRVRSHTSPAATSVNPNHGIWPDWDQPDEAQVEQIEATPRFSPPIQPEEPTPVTRAIDKLEENVVHLFNNMPEELQRRMHLAEVQRANLNYNDASAHDDSNDVQEVEIRSSTSSVSFTQRPKPIPVPRRSLTSPSPAVRTSVAEPELSQKLTSTQGAQGPLDNYDPPWLNPYLSPDIQQIMKEVYQRGRKDGSQFGSQGGSIAGTLSPTMKVRQYLNSTITNTANVIQEEPAGKANDAPAPQRDIGDVIREFQISEEDRASIVSKCQKAKQEAAKSNRLRLKAKAAYDDQKGVVTRHINVFLANAMNPGWEIGNLNEKLNEAIKTMQKIFAVYLSYVDNDEEELLAREEWAPRLLKATENLSLADGFAQLQKQEKRKNKKIATNPEQGELAPNEPVPVPQISNFKQKVAQNLSTFPSEPLTAAVTSAPAVTSAATFSEKIGFKAMNLLATGFQKISTTTPLTLSTSTVTSVAATRSGMTMVTAATLPPVVTLTTATTVTTDTFVPTVTIASAVTFVTTVTTVTIVTTKPVF